jgi:hypothetical protein
MKHFLMGHVSKFTSRKRILTPNNLPRTATNRVAGTYRIVFEQCLLFLQQVMLKNKFSGYKKKTAGISNFGFLLRQGCLHWRMWMPPGRRLERDGRHEKKERM